MYVIWNCYAIYHRYLVWSTIDSSLLGITSIGNYDKIFDTRKLRWYVCNITCGRMMSINGVSSFYLYQTKWKLSPMNKALTHRFFQTMKKFLLRMMEVEMEINQWDSYYRMNLNLSGHIHSYHKYRISLFHLGLVHGERWSFVALKSKWFIIVI